MTNPTRRSLIASAAAASIGMSIRPLRAQDGWPNRMITYLVPYPPGGTTDVLARLIVAKLAGALNTTMIVENKAGATGTIGTEAVARAAPDGYTLLGTSTGPQSIVPNLNRRLAYDPERSFAPIVLIGRIPSVLIVAGNSPYKTLADLVAEAKKRPGALSYASGGVGTILHLSGELLKLRAGIDLLHVPYRGDTPAIQDVMAGHATMMFAPVTPIIPHVQTGKLRAIAVASPRRVKSLPDVPTTSEIGLQDAEAEQWQAIYAPAGTPPAIVARLNGEIGRIIAAPETLERFDQLGVTPGGGTPENLAALQKAEIVKWGQVIKAAGVQLE